MKQIIPFGNRILVKRQRIGEKAGTIVLPENVQERATDLATVVYTPDLTFGDKEILDNAEAIVKATVKQAKEGNSYAVNTLLEFNNFIKMKSIKTGDKVMVSKYVGMDFTATGESEALTLLNVEDVIGIVMEK